MDFIDCLVVAAVFAAPTLWLCEALHSIVARKPGLPEPGLQWSAEMGKLVCSIHHSP